VVAPRRDCSVIGVECCTLQSFFNIFHDIIENVNKHIPQKYIFADLYGDAISREQLQVKNIFAYMCRREAVR